MTGIFILPGEASAGNLARHRADRLGGERSGLTPELVLAPGVLYVRTGGQFTRLKDGEVVARVLMA